MEKLWAQDFLGTVITRYIIKILVYLENIKKEYKTERQIEFNS